MLLEDANSPYDDNILDIFYSDMIYMHQHPESLYSLHIIFGFYYIKCKLDITWYRNHNKEGSTNITFLYYILRFIMKNT